MRHGKGVAVHIREPSLLLYPRPMAHRFITDAERGADFVCANLSFEGGSGESRSPPRCRRSCACRSTQMQGSEAVLELLFEEAVAQNCGRQAHAGQVV